MGREALWLLLPLPALNAVQSLYQGVVVHARATRIVTESVVLYIATIGAALAAGVAIGRLPGLWIAALASVLGAAAQVAWLAWRARGEVRALAVADAAARG
jgi:hypothetical protein